jgi:hypothetical protein
MAPGDTAPKHAGGNADGNGGGTASSGNATSPREGGTLEVHRPQFSQRAAASAHPQAGPNRIPSTPTGRIKPTNQLTKQRLEP